MRTLLGPLIYPDGSPMANVTLMLRAQRVNWSASGLVVNSSEYKWLTDQNGNFAQPVALGDYQAWYEVPGGGGEQRIGPVAVEAGPSVELGELIEETRDKSADYSISADWATQAWVIAQITLGATPYDVNITALNPGAGTPGQLYRVNGPGTLLEPFTLQLKDVPTGNGVANGMLYEKPGGGVGTLPIDRIVSGNTGAAPGDRILINMNGAAGNLNITLPTGTSVGQPSVSLFVISDNYFLPHTINVVRPAGQTIMGIADNLQITRRRSMVLRYVGGNDWRFS